MRINITFELPADRKDILIPVNYQYPLSAWMYKTVGAGNPDVADWLHSEGFEADKKHFRHFTFSRLNLPSFRVENDMLRILSDTATLTLSFYSEKITEPFIYGLFTDQALVISGGKGQVELQIRTVERLPDPLFAETMTYRCLSPVHVAYRNERSGRIDHLHPDHREYESLIIQNMVSKVRTHDEGYAAPEREKTALKILTEPKMNGVVIKQGRADETKLIGYLFDFRLTAPVELHRAGYFAGFGKANSMGFGCVEAMEKKN